MRTQHNVPLDVIWQNDLCSGCGVCAAICPGQIIDLVFTNEGFYKATIPKTKIERCTACELCAKVCPVLSNDTSDVLETSPNQSNLVNWLIGPNKHIYTGHATNNDLRYQCSSGGIITAILSYLMEEKHIDGALIAEPIPGNSIRHRIGLVRTVEDIINNRGTVYCQLDYSAAWKFIEENHSQDKIAVVGQPCHLKAADLFMDAKKLDTSKIFKIGLFCGGTSSHSVLEYLCRRQKARPEEVLSINYRSGGWPGRKMIATLPHSNKNAETRNVVLFERDASLLQNYLYNLCFSGPFFPKSCLICKDQTAEHADISLGDAWLPGFMSSDRFGTNIIISRTLHAQEVLLGAIGNGIIELDDARPKDIIDSQGNCLVGRKLGMWGKHIKNDFQNYQEFSLCKRYLPKYVPSKRLLLERRFFRYLAIKTPSNFALMCFTVYNFTMTIFEKFKLIIIKAIRWIP